MEKVYFSAERQQKGTGNILWSQYQHFVNHGILLVSWSKFFCSSGETAHREGPNFSNRPTPRDWKTCREQASLPSYDGKRIWSQLKDNKKVFSSCPFIGSWLPMSFMSSWPSSQVLYLDTASNLSSWLLQTDQCVEYLPSDYIYNTSFIIPLLHKIIGNQSNAMINLTSSWVILDCTFEGRTVPDTTSWKVHVLDHTLTNLTTVYKRWWWRVRCGKIHAVPQQSPRLTSLHCPTMVSIYSLPKWPPTKPWLALIFLMKILSLNQFTWILTTVTMVHGSQHLSPQGIECCSPETKVCFVNPLNCKAATVDMYGVCPQIPFRFSKPFNISKRVTPKIPMPGSAIYLTLASISHFLLTAVSRLSRHSICTGTTTWFGFLIYFRASKALSTGEPCCWLSLPAFRIGGICLIIVSFRATNARIEVAPLYSKLWITTTVW